MKKIGLISAVVMAVVLCACNQNAPKANLQNNIDSLSYAIGMSQTQGLKQYLSIRMGVDTTEIESFLKGFYESATSGKDAKRKAYLAGLQIGQQVSEGMVQNINQMLFGEDSTQTINEKNVYAGFMAGVADATSIMTVEQANKFVQEKMEVVREEVREKSFGQNRKDGEEFIAKIAKKDGIKELGDGVYYEVLTEGKGEIPADTTKVKLHYEGKLIDGTVFDTDLEGEPHIMFANQVIPGFKLALTHMPVGSKWVVYIPQEQAYGSNDMGKIKPYSALIFTIELLGIEK
ncbi:MAG: FKBP-type peptidyl-prolyl cis-trans isomerase [Bacteroidaceae bacterium]|nr:FKBP-type peptidyl-prolyl cis-trans isomerase [Bacteroidaceae bacterium]